MRRTECITEKWPVFCKSILLFRSFSLSLYVRRERILWFHHFVFILLRSLSYAQNSRFFVFLSVAVDDQEHANEWKREWEPCVKRTRFAPDEKYSRSLRGGCCCCRFWLRWNTHFLCPFDEKCACAKQRQCEWEKETAKIVVCERMWRSWIRFYCVGGSWCMRITSHLKITKKMSKRSKRIKKKKELVLRLFFFSFFFFIVSTSETTIAFLRSNVPGELCHCRTICKETQTRHDDDEIENWNFVTMSANKQRAFYWSIYFSLAFENILFLLSLRYNSMSFTTELNSIANKRRRFHSLLYFLFVILSLHLLFLVCRF